MSYWERDWWRPRTRREAEEWLVSRGRLTKSQVKRLTKKQVFGVYGEEREMR